MRLHPARFWTTNLPGRQQRQTNLSYEYDNLNCWRGLVAGCPKMKT
jgi:hypothetical protein